MNYDKNSLEGRQQGWVDKDEVDMNRAGEIMKTKSKHDTAPSDFLAYYTKRIYDEGTKWWKAKKERR